MVKRALIVGINYVGTEWPLRGCINDANHMQRLVVDKFGFTETKVLLEADATTAGILAGLQWLVADIKPGDVALFYFSGHGSQVRSNIEPDGLDEIICPIDIDWKSRIIKDDDLKAVLSQAPNGTNVTVILDCCHSGSGLDLAGSLFTAGADLSPEPVPLEGRRFMPPPAEVEDYIRQEGLELRDFKTSRDINRSALLIAACLPYQVAMDALIAGEFQGAATYALRQAVAEDRRTYREVVEHMSAYMVRNMFTQRPQLDGHPSLYDQLFLEPWGTAPGQLAVVPPPGTWQPNGQVKPAVDGGSQEDSGWAILAALLAVGVGILLLGTIQPTPR